MVGRLWGRVVQVCPWGRLLELRGNPSSRFPAGSWKRALAGQPARQSIPLQQGDAMVARKEAGVVA